MHWVKYALACVSLVMLPVSTSLCSAQSATFVHQKRYVMGTVFEIVIYDDDLPKADAAARAALEEVVRLDGVMSNYKPESELSKLNRTAHLHPVRVSRELYDVIRQSLYYSRISEGQFDISVGPVVDLWKAALAGGSLPTTTEQAAALRCVGYKEIELLPPDRLEFHSDCMRLDLGAIGKGYAVDRVAELLKARGIRRAYIDAGGSTIYAMGAPPGANAWNVQLRDPSGKLVPQTKLINNSVSTSEQSAPSVLQGEAPGHIVLPQTGKPLQTRYAVSVVAPTATASDALSTTLLLLGPTKGSALAKTLHNVTAIWIDSDGQRTLAGEGAKFQLAGEKLPMAFAPTNATTMQTSKARKDSNQ
jgi:thiamine biosynthesis lipoprotein